MKNSILLTSFILSILFLSTSIQAQDSLQVEALVAYYPFNGDASDSSGYGNDGDVFGAELTRDRFGNLNSAYKFDGIDDFIYGGSSESLKIKGDLSLSFWLKVDSFEGLTSGIITYQGSNNGEISKNALYKINFPDDNSFNYNHEDKSGNSNISTFPNAELETNKWYHVVLTRDTTQKYLQLFINRALIDTAYFSTVPFGGELSSLRIGENHGTVNSDRFFNGILDDIRIYNYSITDSTIQDLYSENDWPDTKWEIPETLVANYPFNGNANDKSSFGNDGEVFGATLTEDRFGKANSAYKFDGTDNYLEISNDHLFNTLEKTVSFWFKKNDETISENSTGNYSEGLLFKSFTSGIDREFGFEIARTSPPFNLLFSAGSDTNNELKMPRDDMSIMPGFWYHVTGKIDSSSISLYLDGEKVDSVSHSGSLYRNNSPIVLGKVSMNSLIERYFNGALDDLRIYNYALSDSSISDLYTEGGWPLPEDTTIVPNDTLAAYFPFNGDASDSSGYNNHALVFGAELTKDRFGRDGFAYLFDGENDFIEIENPEMLHSKKNLSFSFWAKGISEDSSFVGLIAKKNMEPFGLGIDNGGRVLFSISNNRIPLNMVIDNLSVDPEEWYQYIAVFKAGEYMRLFQNGTEIGTLYGSIPTAMDISSGSILIGATEILSESVVDTLFYKGAIDEVRFYNYDLDPEEVNLIYVSESEPPVGISTDEEFLKTPQTYQLYQNYPNPFNPSTTIKFDLPELSNVSLKVYDITGRLVASLINEVKPSGTYQLNFDASGLASGIYLYELKTNSFSSIKKFTLIK